MWERCETGRRDGWEVQEKITGSSVGLGKDTESSRRSSGCCHSTARYSVSSNTIRLRSMTELTNFSIDSKSQIRRFNLESTSTFQLSLFPLDLLSTIHSSRFYRRSRLSTFIPRISSRQTLYLNRLGPFDRQTRSLTPRKGDGSDSKT